MRSPGRRPVAGPLREPRPVRGGGGGGGGGGDPAECRLRPGTPRRVVGRFAAVDLEATRGLSLGAEDCESWRCVWKHLPGALEACPPHAAPASAPARVPYRERCAQRATGRGCCRCPPGCPGRPTSHCVSRRARGALAGAAPAGAPAWPLLAKRNKNHDEHRRWTIDSMLQRRRRCHRTRLTGTRALCAHGPASVDSGSASAGTL